MAEEEVFPEDIDSVKDRSVLDKMARANTRELSQAVEAFQRLSPESRASQPDFWNRLTKQISTLRWRSKRLISRREQIDRDASAPKSVEIPEEDGEKPSVKAKKWASRIFQEAVQLIQEAVADRRECLRRGDSEGAAAALRRERAIGMVAEICQRNFGGR
jgi:hypothetical protein